MVDILSYLKKSTANVKLEISTDDLLKFSEALIYRTIKEFNTTSNQPTQEDVLISKETVKKRFGVCDATLWHWAKKKYLVPVKIGSKVKYRESDVKKNMGLNNMENNL